MIFVIFALGVIPDDPYDSTSIYMSNISCGAITDYYGLLIIY